MSLTTGFEIGFAVAAGVSALALTGASLRVIPRTVLVLLALGVTGAAVAAWAEYAVHHSRPRELALAAGGLTICAFATFASLIVEWGLTRASATDACVAAAQARLQDLFDAATVER